MTANNSEQSDTLNQFKEVPESVAIIDSAVEAVVNSFIKIDSTRAAFEKAEGSQLHALMAGLKDYPGTMTEGVWDAVYRAKVRARLDQATVNGAPRYKNDASRDVIVNMLKAATIAITLSKSDPSYAPAPDAKNLKKYADEARSRLQVEIDPATGQPRIKSGAKTAKQRNQPKTLVGETYYWLVGCEDAEKGVGAANTILAGDHDLERLKKVARQAPAGKFAAFRYLTSKIENLEVEAEEIEDLDPPIMNSAVFAQTLSMAG